MHNGSNERAEEPCILIGTTAGVKPQDKINTCYILLIGFKSAHNCGLLMIHLNFLCIYIHATNKHTYENLFDIETEGGE